MSGYTFPYLSNRQSTDQVYTEWEISLASAIEDAFSKGHHQLDALVAALNASRVRPKQGGEWTAENFQNLMRELGG